jgi:hypothetical protein
LIFPIFDKFEEKSIANWISIQNIYFIQNFDQNSRTYYKFCSIEYFRLCNLNFCKDFQFHIQSIDCWKLDTAFTINRFIQYFYISFSTILCKTSLNSKRKISYLLPFTQIITYSDKKNHVKCYNIVNESQSQLFYSIISFFYEKEIKIIYSYFRNL